MISLHRVIKREHCGKRSKEIYPYWNWLCEKESSFQDKWGKQDDYKQKFCPFSPENFPLPIK